MKIFLLCLLVVPLNLFAINLFPDIKFTSGSFCTAKHSDFKEYRYKANIPICKRRVTSGVKTKVYNSYNVPKSERKNYTVDHYIPLFMGGDNSIENLWPQHRMLSTAKIEQRLYFLLSGGRLSHNESLWFMLEIKNKKPRK